VIPPCVSSTSLPFSSLILQPWVVVEEEGKEEEEGIILLPLEAPIRLRRN
jgi:hypothetical protein